MPRYAHTFLQTCSVHYLPYILKQVAEKIAWPEFNQTFLPISWLIAGYWPPLSESLGVFKSSWKWSERTKRQGLVFAVQEEATHLTEDMDDMEDMDDDYKIRNQVTQRLHSKDLVDGPRSFAVQELSAGTMLTPLRTDLNVYEPCLTKNLDIMLFDIHVHVYLNTHPTSKIMEIHGD